MLVSDMARPSFREIVRILYWAVRRNPSSAPHVAGAVARALRSRYREWGWGRRRSRRVLAVALIEHMGDIVAAEPVGRAARAAYPAAEIVWVVRAPYSPLVAAFAAIDRTIVVRCVTEWLVLWGCGFADMVWDLHVSGRPCPVCGVGHVKRGPAAALTLANYYDHGNLLEVQCRSAGLPVLREGPQLDPGEAARDAVDALGLPARFVVVHCRSNEPERDWVTAKWQELLDRLRQLGEEAVEIGTEPLVATAAQPWVRNLCGRLDLLASAEVIRRARLFIGIDSGPAHLANAVRTPGVILLGAYRTFRHYRPYSGYYDSGGAMLLCADGPAASLPLSPVLAAVEQRLAVASVGAR